MRKRLKGRVIEAALDIRELAVRFSLRAKEAKKIVGDVILTPSKTTGKQTKEERLLSIAKTSVRWSAFSGAAVAVSLATFVAGDLAGLNTSSKVKNLASQSAQSAIEKGSETLDNFRDSSFATTVFGISDNFASDFTNFKDNVAQFLSTDRGHEIEPDSPTLTHNLTAEEFASLPASYHYEITDGSNMFELTPEEQVKFDEEQARIDRSIAINSIEIPIFTAEDMQVSNNYIETLKEHEAIPRNSKGQVVAYDDGVGNATIGWGSTGGGTGIINGKPLIINKTTISDEMAVNLLKQDLEVASQEVRDIFKGHHLTQEAFDVAVDFAFNKGGSNLRRSIMAKEFKNGNFEAGAKNLLGWTTARVVIGKDENGKPIHQKDAHGNDVRVRLKGLYNRAVANMNMVINSLPEQLLENKESYKQAIKNIEEEGRSVDRKIKRVVLKTDSLDSLSESLKESVELAKKQANNVHNTIHKLSRFESIYSEDMYNLKAEYYDMTHNPPSHYSEEALMDKMKSLSSFAMLNQTELDKIKPILKGFTKSLPSVQRQLSLLANAKELLEESRLIAENSSIDKAQGLAQLSELIQDEIQTLKKEGSIIPLMSVNNIEKLAAGLSHADNVIASNIEKINQESRTLASHNQH